MLIYRSRNIADESIFSFAFSLAFASSFSFACAPAAAGAVFAVVVPFVGAVAVVAAVIVGGTIVVVAGASASYVAATVACAAAGAIIVLIGAMQNWSEGKGWVAWLWLSYSALFLVVGTLSLSYLKGPAYYVFLIFFMALPLVNAPLDWLSLGGTRGLLQAVRAGHHGAGFALAWGFLDLLFALGFLFLIAAVLVLATALGNIIAGETLVDLQVIFSELRADRSSVNHWWVYFMLLSTLVPTLVHFALAGGAATLWLPQILREDIARNLDLNHYKIGVAWAYLTFTPAIGFVFAPALLLCSLYWLVSMHGGWFGGQLLDWAEWLAMAVNPKIVAQP